MCTLYTAGINLTECICGVQFAVIANFGYVYLHCATMPAAIPSASVISAPFATVVAEHIYKPAVLSYICHDIHTSLYDTFCM